MELLRIWGQRDAAIVQLLLDNGTQIEARNSKGLTPLMLAARLGQKEVVSVLLKAGAKSDAISKNGETVVQQVERCGSANIKSLPIKQKVRTGQNADSWYSAKSIQSRETLIRQTLKREEAEMIQLIAKR